MEIDIATLLENHRRHMLTVVNEQEYDNEDELAASRFAVMSAHDRATTKALLDLYRTSQGTGQPATATNTVAIATASRKVKAGSKKARDRAIKAGETRRRNLIAKTQQSGGLTPIAGGPIVDDSANREGGAA
jgi:hypothetical protein